MLIYSNTYSSTSLGYAFISFPMLLLLLVLDFKFTVSGVHSVAMLNSLSDINLGND